LLLGLFRSHLLHETIKKRRPFHMLLIRLAHISWDHLAARHALQQQSTANALFGHASDFLKKNPLSVSVPSLPLARQ
jgi:hypothetical protein